MGWICIHTQVVTRCTLKSALIVIYRFITRFEMLFFRLFKHLICMLIKQADTLVDYALLLFIWKHSHSIEHPHIYIFIHDQYITHTANLTTNFTDFRSNHPSIMFSWAIKVSNRNAWVYSFWLNEWFLMLTFILLPFLAFFFFVVFTTKQCWCLTL